MEDMKVRLNLSVSDDQPSNDQSITLSPRVLAELFWSMNCEQQAAFFAALGEIAEIGPFQMQIILLREHCDKLAKQGQPGARDTLLDFASCCFHYGPLHEQAERWMLPS